MKKKGDENEFVLEGREGFPHRGGWFKRRELCHFTQAKGLKERTRKTFRYRGGGKDERNEHSQTETYNRIGSKAPDKIDTSATKKRVQKSVSYKPHISLAVKRVMAPPPEYYGTQPKVRQ